MAGTFGAGVPRKELFQVWMSCVNGKSSNECSIVRLACSSRMPIFSLDTFCVRLHTALDFAAVTFVFSILSATSVKFVPRPIFVSLFRYSSTEYTVVSSPQSLPYRCLRFALNWFSRYDATHRLWRRRLTAANLWSSVGKSVKDLLRTAGASISTSLPIETSVADVERCNLLSVVRIIIGLYF